MIVVSNDKLLEVISENVNMKRAFKLIDDILFQTIKSLIDKIVLLNNNTNTISTILKQKLFILNHKDCTLGVSLGCNSLNSIVDLENIHINFDEKDLSVTVTDSPFMNKLLKHF